MVPSAGSTAAEMTTLLPDGIAPAAGENAGVGQGCSAAIVPEEPVPPPLLPLNDPLVLPLLPPVPLPLLPLLPLPPLLLLPPHPTMAPKVSSVTSARAAVRIMLRPPIVRPMVVPFIHDS